MADDLGYADVGCYGRTDISTPRIDALAARGVRLLQGYANSPVCSATRAALMTGRYQYRLRIGLEEPLLNTREDVGLPAELTTLPSLLQKSGYETMLIGKWHLGMLPKFDPGKAVTTTSTAFAVARSTTTRILHPTASPTFGTTTHR